MSLEALSHMASLQQPISSPRAGGDSAQGISVPGPQPESQGNRLVAKCVNSSKLKNLNII